MGRFGPMAPKRLFLLVSLLVLLVDGHMPAGRELRNPDAEGGHGGSIARPLSQTAKRPGA